MNTRFERELIINSRRLTYKGIFRADEVFALTNKILEMRGFEKREKKNEELVVEEGKKIYVELRPFKDKTTYVRLVMKVKFLFDNMTSVVEEVDGIKKKFDSGDVEILFDAWMLTDQEARWGMKPLVFFVKGFINKFIFKWPLEKGFYEEIVADTAHLYGQLKRLFNSYKEEVGKVVQEEKVRQQVQEEIEREILDLEKEGAGKVVN